MGTVFGKNTTSSSITVAGHKTYYIDSTDAEIVEVEGQGGGGSIASDDATGTISGVTLPTEHSYTGVSFDSLRYYVKGTVSDRAYEYGLYGISSEWYGGTITWMDESLGDLSGLIFTTGTPSTSSSSAVTQTILRVFLITVNSISGYPVRDTMYPTGAGQISDYTYNNGVHSIRLWFANIGMGDWTYNSLAGRLMLRFLDDTTTFDNLSAFDLINASGGSLSKVTTTDRYDMYNVWGGNITLHAMYGSGETIRRNAFKYTLSGTPYWYVIDGEHDTWTDDLSAWGYSEVPVGPVLPEVTTNKWSCPAVSSGIATLSPNATYLLWNNLTDQSNISYDDSLAYAVNFWEDADNNLGGHIELSLIKLASKLGIQNNSNQTLTVYWVNYSTCSDSTATVVTVYNSSNVAYNAFKYTANNVDYYYVLDGTQTDWTDDLAGIGYRSELILYLNQSKTNQYVGYSSIYTLYDTSGSTIPVDATYASEIRGLRMCSSDGTAVYSNTFAGFQSGDGILKWYNSEGGVSGVAYFVCLPGVV